MKEADLERIALTKALNDLLMEELQKDPEDLDPNLAEIVQILVDQGAFINARDENGMTPIFYATNIGNIDVLRSVVDLGANVNGQDDEGWSPLLIAASNGNLECVKYLVLKGADIRFSNRDGFSVLDIAHANEHYEVYEYLLEQQKVISEEINGDDKIWRFFNAINTGNEIEVANFIRRGIDVNYSDQNYPNAPLVRACAVGNYNNVLALLSAGAGVDNHGHGYFAPIHYAISGGHENIVRLLLNHKVELEKQDGFGNTALISSVVNGQEKIVRILLDWGVDVEAKNYDGKNSLELAVNLGNRNMVQLLKSGGADISLLDSYGKREILSNKGIDVLYEISSEYTKRIILAALEDDNIALYDKDSEGFSFAREVLGQSGKFKSESDLNNFIKYSLANAIIHLSYDKKTEGGLVVNEASEIIRHVILNSEPFEKRDDILGILEAIYNKDKINLAHEHYVKVIKLPYSNHAAYFCVIYNNKDQPIKISYCDGNNGSIVGATREGLNYTYGVFSAKIDPDKIAAFVFEGKDWLQELLDNIGSNYKEVLKDKAEKLTTAMKEVVLVNERGGFERRSSIPMQPQERENCTFKSINIVVREILRIMDRTMVFSTDGRPGGKGYDIYKQYKKCLTKDPIEEVVDFIVSHPEKEDFTYGFMSRIVENRILPKAIAKNDGYILEKLSRAFGSEFIDESSDYFGRISLGLKKVENADMLESLDREDSPDAITNSFSPVTMTNISHESEKYESGGIEV